MKRMACVLALAAGTGIVLGTGVQPVLADPAPATVSSGLKLNIVPPGTVTNDGPIKLDVNFRGGTIRSIELLVDGARVFKKAVKLSDTNGAFNFSIPGDLLPEGDHEVIVIAYDTDGNTATSSVRMHISAAQLDGIAHFVYPKRDAKVQEVVPIEIKLDPGINNPYVTFLLDNDFMAIRNYGPYIYNWDSKKVANGHHTISVEIYDAGTNELRKKMSISVDVLNQGGLTNRQNNLPVIKAPTALKSTLGNIIGAAISAPSGSLSEDNAGLSRSAQPMNTYTVRGSQPSADTFNTAKPLTQPDSVVPPLGPTPLDVLNTNAGIGSNDPKNVGTRGATPGTSLGNFNALIGAPEPTIGEGALPDEGRLSRVKLYARRAGNIAARPRTQIGSTSAVDPIQPMSVQPLPHTKVTPRYNHAIKTFDVAFDNSRIAFDVPPRVERGMPLAPFRAIFEHSGGSVEWFNKSKTVRAVNSSREIEFKVGEKVARVNNHKVNMAAKPYVERGRTIVPLSFVKDAMNVKVTYDAKSGHLLIESKK